MPEDKWHANIPDHHEAYITKEEFEENQAILDQNRSQFKSDGSRVSPRAKVMPCCRESAIAASADIS